MSLSSKLLSIAAINLTNMEIIEVLVRVIIYKKDITCI